MAFQMFNPAPAQRHEDLRLQYWAETSGIYFMLRNAKAWLFINLSDYFKSPFFEPKVLVHAKKNVQERFSSIEIKIWQR